MQRSSKQKYSTLQHTQYTKGYTKEKKNKWTWRRWVEYFVSGQLSFTFEYSWIFADLGCNKVTKAQLISKVRQVAQHLHPSSAKWLSELLLHLHSHGRPDHTGACLQLSVTLVLAHSAKCYFVKACQGSFYKLYQMDTAIFFPAGPPVEIHVN